MIRGLKQAAKSLGIDSTVDDKENIPPQHMKSSEEVPMMYRAQIDGRCSLMFAGRNDDLEDWKEEWVYPNPEKPRYQKEEPPLGLDGKIYRIKVEFPFRVLSNCGQDSIIRPIMGKDGIPYFSGSSIKGLFRRACNENQVKKYCGDDDDLAPSELGFRFHGAYPIGDWSGMHKVKVWEKGQEVTKVRYRMLDVVHPQQGRQVGSSRQRGATALASVSLYQPTLIFEFSSANPDTNWKEVETIFWRAIALGVGGKTSTGYGFGGHNDHRPAVFQQGKANVMLIGRGVSPTLRSGEAEFRPNMFKASLRGHFQRLLAGVVGEEKPLKEAVDRLFGSSTNPGAIQLFWEQRKEVSYGQFGATQTFEADGILHINALQDKDVQLIEQVLKFAFVMGGFGKSWRRASHQKFHKTYKKFEIGCHWELPAMDRSWMQIKSTADLKSFLDQIHQGYKDQFGKGNPLPLDWRESWHPDRVSVYASITQESKAITLLHDDTYKTTLAIGGRRPHKEHPKKTKPPESCSHVWHRMLPVGENQFLEIVAVFHTEREKWKHPSEGDQLDKFIQSLKDQGLSLVWGRSDPLSKKAVQKSGSRSHPNSKPKSGSKPKPKPRKR
jgi:CRISPR-associated protein Cmr6